MLFVVLSLYMACLIPTKEYGPDDIREQVANVPIRRTVDASTGHDGRGSTQNGGNYFNCRHYYLWLFGFVVELPYERPLN